MRRGALGAFARIKVYSTPEGVFYRWPWNKRSNKRPSILQKVEIGTFFVGKAIGEGFVVVSQ